MTQWLGIGLLPFSFEGLVLGSVIYSLPFAVQPLQHAFEAIGERPLEVAATLRAGPWDTFFAVAVPLARPGFVNAAVLSFAHTVGWFPGVVLMLGGNIPGQTRVVSVQILLQLCRGHAIWAGPWAGGFDGGVLLRDFAGLEPAHRKQPGMVR